MAGNANSKLKLLKLMDILNEYSDDEHPLSAPEICAMLGDYVEVGCNSVLNPGTVIGRNSNIYPTSCVRGTVPEGSIYKNNGKVIKKND